MYLLARRRNLPHLNGRQAIVDPATGGWLSGLGSDDLHANADGAWEHGNALADEILTTPCSYPQNPYLIDANDADSILAVEVK